MTYTAEEAPDKIFFKANDESITLNDTTENMEIKLFAHPARGGVPMGQEVSVPDSPGSSNSSPATSAPLRISLYAKIGSVAFVLEDLALRFSLSAGLYSDPILGVQGAEVKAQPLNDGANGTDTNYLLGYGKMSWGLSSVEIGKLQSVAVRAESGTGVARLEADAGFGAAGFLAISHNTLIVDARASNNGNFTLGAGIEVLWGGTYGISLDAESSNPLNLTISVGGKDVVRAHKIVSAGLGVYAESDRAGVQGDATFAANGTLYIKGGKMELSAQEHKNGTALLSPPELTFHRTVEEAAPKSWKLDAGLEIAWGSQEFAIEGSITAPLLPVDIKLIVNEHEILNATSFKLVKVKAAASVEKMASLTLAAEFGEYGRFIISPVRDVSFEMSGSDPELPFEIRGELQADMSKGAEVLARIYAPDQPLNLSFAIGSYTVVELLRFVDFEMTTGFDAPTDTIYYELLVNMDRGQIGILDDLLVVDDVVEIATTFEASQKKFKVTGAANIGNITATAEWGAFVAEVIVQVVPASGKLCLDGRMDAGVWDIHIASVVGSERCVKDGAISFAKSVPLAGPGGTPYDIEIGLSVL